VFDSRLLGDHSEIIMLEPVMLVKRKVHAMTLYFTKCAVYYTTRFS
jgi:hypothetical protein